MPGVRVQEYKDQLDEAEELQEGGSDGCRSASRNGCWSLRPGLPGLPAQVHGMSFWLNQSRQPAPGVLLRAQRMLPHLFVAFGSSLLVLAYTVGLGRIHPDPASEAVALDSRQSMHVVEFGFAGVVLFLTGGLWILGNWAKRRFFSGGK